MLLFFMANLKGMWNFRFEWMGMKRYLSEAFIFKSYKKWGSEMNSKC
jgi:hypothetical protein